MLCVTGGERTAGARGDGGGRRGPTGAASRMHQVLENVTIDAWAARFRRHPGQINPRHGSDAELIPMPGGDGRCLAVTIDTVAEEIRTGLYRDPYTMGWVAVNASLSDLAAVGAEPLGLVVSVTAPGEWPPESVELAGRGMEEACQALEVFILGGDTNTAPWPSFTACALGAVERDAALTRRFAPGDTIFVSGPVGTGNALALVRLAGLPEELFPESSYRPRARLSLGRSLAGRAAGCMDTSDGLLATLDQLMRLNGCGIEIDCDWPAILAGETFALCRQTGIPGWMMLAGPHGEFELVAAVSPPRLDAFVREMEPAGLIRIGVVREDPVLALNLPTGRRAEIDMAPVRNLLEQTGGDLARYLGELARLGRRWGLE